MVINKKKTLMLACDFETTVYEGQESTEVWSAAYAVLYRDKVNVEHSIEDFIKDLSSYRKNIICWFHNEKFDGSFIVDYLLKNGWEWTNEKRPDTKQFKTLISGKNRWYSMTLNTGNGIIEIRDSAKLMPMTLAEMGKAFNTKHRKLEMEYKGTRYAGCSITAEEMEYIINDVLVLKEALEYMIDNGHTNLTIGSCALNEYASKLTKSVFNTMFPRLTDIGIEDYYQASNADEYIRKAYRGGFCYLKRGMEGRVSGGKTYDVNSLYPSVMHSKSGNRYPIGRPHFWKGDIPSEALKEARLYFVQVRCRFNLKENHLPTIQIKGNAMYRGNEWLETSDIKVRGKLYKRIFGKDGEIIEAKPTLTLTSVDYKLFKEHYNVEEEEVLSGCWFYTEIGLFNDYIDFWGEKKMKAKTKGERTEAKLFLNNLYGKFASSTDSSYRYPVLRHDGVVEYVLEEENNKEAGYIAVGAFVTSYARYFTITHGQLNYDKFIYSDTDSLHLLDGDHVGLKIHPSDLLCWKLEKEWSSGIFIRQKTYAEFVRKIDGERVNARWDITCAGMPDRCKEIFLKTRPITDFKYGLSIYGKLQPTIIPGGTILKETYFTLHRK